MSRASTGNKKRGPKKRGPGRPRKQPVYAEEPDQVEVRAKLHSGEPVVAETPSEDGAPPVLSEFDLAQMDPNEAAALIRDNQEAYAEHAESERSKRVAEARKRFAKEQAKAEAEFEANREVFEAQERADRELRAEKAAERRAFYANLREQHQSREAEVRKKMAARNIKKEERREPYQRAPE